VINIDHDCVAQVIYGKNSKPSPKSKIVQSRISGGALSIPRPDGGVTSFEVRDNALMGQYSGPAGFNQALMQRVAPDAVGNHDAEQQDQAAMIPLPEGVSAQCAAFHGHWSGSWSQGGVGQQFLRVVEVRALGGGGCQVRFSYSSSRSPLVATQVVAVDSGSIAFVCNPTTGGTCVFRPAGNELTASYTNPAGGTNSATFRRMQ
jgi:hypothetical protein